MKGGKGMRKVTAMVLAIIFMVSFSLTAIAAEPETGKGKTYPAGPIQKAERGFSNAAFGWTEIPKRIVDKTKETNNPIKGLLLGLYQGTCKAFARTTSGVADFATFPIGSYEKPAVMPDMPAAEQ